MEEWLWGRECGSTYWKIPRKSGNFKRKGGPVFPAGISERNFVFHLHVSRSLYQFQVHGKKISHGQLANQSGFHRAHVSMHGLRLFFCWPHNGGTSGSTSALASARTGIYDQMEQLFTNRKFHFCSHRNFRVFFLNGKRP